MRPTQLHTMWRLFSAVAVVLACPIVARAGTGTWSVAPTPAGYSGQITAIYTPPGDSPSFMYLASGFARIWSTPLGGTLSYTAYPSTGLAFPWAIDQLVANASQQPVLVQLNVQNANQNIIRYYDAASATWAQSSPTTLVFTKPPILALMKSGDLIASTVDSIYVSTDGGASFSLRSMLRDSFAAPAPLPVGGSAVLAPVYGTNAINVAYAGYTEAINVMPWGEVFLGNESLQEWHSFDEGRTWEHTDALWYQPQRNMSGVPLYPNPHLATFGRGGNTSGAGKTASGDVIMNCDQNNGQNFYLYTSSGQIVPIDGTNVDLPYTDPNSGFSSPMNLWQVRRFHTLQSGDTFTNAVSWDHSNTSAIPNGRNGYEVAQYDGTRMNLATPGAGNWSALYSDSSTGGSDGINYFTLSSETGAFLKQWTPAPAANVRPTVKLLSSPQSVTISAATGIATFAPAGSFQIADDGVPGTGLKYAWSARGPGPVTFDAPLALNTNATFSTPGDYVVTLKVNDGQLTSGNAVMVHVLPAAGGAAPAITTQPMNQVLVAGQPVQFGLVATGAQLTYQWLRNGIEITDGATFAGTRTAQLTIKSASMADYDSIYACRVSSPFGRALSHGATLGGPPVITTQPQDQIAPAGTTMTFSVAADGSHPMRWQWYAVNGAQRTAISGANRSAYSTSTPGTYSVDLINCFGTVTSSTAQYSVGAGSTLTLQVNSGGGNSTAGGGTYAFSGGGTAHIAISADRFAIPSYPSKFSGWTANGGVQIGDPSSPQTYITIPSPTAGQTYSVGSHYTTVTPSLLTVINGTGTGVARVSTFRAGGSVEISAYDAPAGMTFDHWVGGPIDGSMSSTVSFTMPSTETLVVATYKSTSSAVAPSITSQPSDLTVDAGQTAMFLVGASGTPSVAYHWFRDGQPISGAQGSSYSFSTVAGDDGAQFTVTVSNSAGSVTSDPAMLTVRVPVSIQMPPVDQTVNVGKTASFAVIASGTDPLSYQWYRDTQPIPNAKGASYTTDVVSASDDGAVFTVTVSNAVNAATSMGAVLHVNVPPSIQTPPTKQSVLVGASATFTVVAAGTAPLSYQWMRDGQAIGGATSATYQTPPATLLDDGATFSVMITNAAGSVTSTPVPLAVSSTVMAPSIDAMVADITIEEGKAATFTVAADGTAPLQYQWYRDGNVIDGAVSSSVTIDPVMLSDDGAAFHVTVTNSAGTATSNIAHLHITPSPVAPTIMTQPADVVVSLGQSATFSVTANGTAPLAYQWTRNGTEIAGATTASYQLPAVGAADAGAMFTVVVSNAAGSVTSDAATLTILVVDEPPPAQPATKAAKGCGCQGFDAGMLGFLLAMGQLAARRRRGAR